MRDLVAATQGLEAEQISAGLRFRYGVDRNGLRVYAPYGGGYIIYAGDGPTRTVSRIDDLIMLLALIHDQRKQYLGGNNET